MISTMPWGPHMSCTRLRIQNWKCFRFSEGIFSFFQVIVNQKSAFQGHNKMMQGLFMPLFSDYCSQSKIHFMLLQHDGAWFIQLHT